MSSVLHPVGPEPPATYWIRRTILTAGVVLVIILLAYSCSGGSKPKKPSGKVSTLTTTSSPTVTPTEPATKPASSRCGPELSAAVETSQRDYTAGDSVRLTATVSNTGTHSCSLESGASRQIWTIRSGNDHVWTNQGCVQSHAIAKLVVKAHKQYVASIVWNGRRRDPKCAIGQPATAGTYVAAATIDGVTATPVVFRLS